MRLTDGRRPPKHRLRTVAVVTGIHTPILIDADVVNAAVGLNEVVVGEVNVVVVNVDGRRLPLKIGFGRAVGRDADAVVKVGNSVVGDDVSGAVDLNGKKTAQLMRRVDACRAPARLVPTDHAHAVFTSQEEIVGDQKVA